MNIAETTLPTYSGLSVPGQRYDYVDSFQGIYHDQQDSIRAVDAGRAFFSSAPEWVDGLFRLRNRVVRLFGLKTPQTRPDRQATIDQLTFNRGEQLGLFVVFDKTDQEIILGQDDKHLDFRVSLLLGPPRPGIPEKQLTISTTVVFHNWLGRLYFLPVRPFHERIVPAMLKALIQQLESNKRPV